MHTSLLLTSLLLYRITNAQSPSNLQLDPQLTCQDGYMPSLSCAEPLPVDEQCSCTCRDGAKFNQTRPDFTGSIPITPSLGDGEKMEGKPCTTDIIHPWIELSLPRNANTLEPSTISSNTIDNPEDSILLVADSRQRCQNFVVFIDDVRVGVTSGEGALDGKWCGSGEECIEKHGGSHAYFKLLQGRRKIGLQWVDVHEALDKCKEYPEAVGSFQVYKPCDPVV